MHSIKDLGLEYVKRPILKVRIVRVDGQWLVEYRRRPRWLFGIDSLWWFNDGKYVDYTEALDRALKLVSQGYTLSLQYIRKEEFEIPQTEGQ
jgi:hypothetical protein